MQYILLCLTTVLFASTVRSQHGMPCSLTNGNGTVLRHNANGCPQNETCDMNVTLQRFDEVIYTLSFCSGEFTLRCAALSLNAMPGLCDIAEPECPGMSTPMQEENEYEGSTTAMPQTKVGGKKKKKKTGKSGFHGAGAGQEVEGATTPPMGATTPTAGATAPAAGVTAAATTMPSAAIPTAAATVAPVNPMVIVTAAPPPPPKKQNKAGKRRVVKKKKKRGRRAVRKRGRAGKKSNKSKAAPAAEPTTTIGSTSPCVEGYEMHYPGGYVRRNINFCSNVDIIPRNFVVCLRGMM